MKLSEYAKKNNITYRTAHRHWKSGILKGFQLETGTIVLEHEVENNEYVIYCRVSSHDQKADLIRQEQRLRDYCSAKGWTVRTVYSEIASGLNDNRSKLNKLLEMNCNIVVEHKDRLTRFGFRYIESLMKRLGNEVIVINRDENKDDLMQDFISIITSFAARIYGRRRSKRNTERIIKELSDEDSAKQ